MRQKFSMSRLLAPALAAMAIVAVAAPVAAQDLRLADNAPQTYTVQKGDTLWDISGRFLRDAWRWPDVWRMNRDQIRNPHLIYPGDVIRLDYVDGQPRLSIASGGPRESVRLSPATRATPLDREAIPTIPPGDIEPYLSRPLVTGPEGLKDSAEIIAGRDRDRVIRGDGDRVYVVGIDAKAGDLWHMYRPVGPIRSLDRKSTLGFEFRFLGSARVERFNEVSTLVIENAKEEILVGDRLVPAPREVLVNYVPHAPTRDVEGRIIATMRDTVELGRGAIVTIDQGRRGRRRRRHGARDLPRRRADPRSAPEQGPAGDHPPLGPDHLVDAGTVSRRPAGAHRTHVRVPRVRPGVLRHPPQHDRSGAGGRLHPQALTGRRQPAPG